MSTVYTIVAVFIFVRMLMYLPIYVVLEAGSYKPSLTPVYSQYITHSLTAALDQLRVVASSTSNDPGPRSRQHQQIGQRLLPLAAVHQCSIFVFYYIKYSPHQIYQHIVIVCHFSTSSWPAE